MQQADNSSKVQSNINVTPLVDVVLVLLIIFMIIAPQLQSDAAVQLPSTDRPQDKPDDGRQIVVTIDAEGAVWIDADRVEADRFEAQMLEAAEGRQDHKVVIKGDARLTFGDVQQAMLAVEAAGFQDVGLIAQRRDES